MSARGFPNARPNRPFVKDNSFTYFPLILILTLILIVQLQGVRWCVGWICITGGERGTGVATAASLAAVSVSSVVLAPTRMMDDAVWPAIWVYAHRPRPGHWTEKHICSMHHSPLGMHSKSICSVAATAVHRNGNAPICRAEKM